MLWNDIFIIIQNKFIGTLYFILQGIICFYCLKKIDGLKVPYVYRFFYDSILLLTSDQLFTSIIKKKLNECVIATIINENLRKNNEKRLHNILLYFAISGSSGSYVQITIALYVMYIFLFKLVLLYYLVCNLTSDMQSVFFKKKNKNKSNVNLTLK